jgi:Family of unknown function (DUF6152)
VTHLIRARRSFVAMALGLTLAAASSASSAHHSTAMFDMSRTVTVQGTVEAFEWTNPHTWIWVNVPSSSGGVDRYGIEGMSPNFLSRNGWTRKALNAGDKVSIDINPLRDGRKGGFCVAVKLADGKVLRSRGG